jgi:hypothetical protein
MRQEDQRGFSVERDIPTGRYEVRDFNYDYHVSFTADEIAQGEGFYNFERRALPFATNELSGVRVFYKDTAGDIFHTYSSYARGDEGGLTTYFYLDLTPKGRNETGPGFNLGDWVRHHDRYEAEGFVDAGGRYHQKEEKRVPLREGSEGVARGRVARCTRTEMSAI